MGRKTSRRPSRIPQSQIVMNDPRGLLWLSWVLGPIVGGHLNFACTFSITSQETLHYSHISIEYSHNAATEKWSVLTY